LFEESKDVIFISTLDGYLIDFNPVTSLYSGYSEEELRRVPVRNFYANPDKMRQFREMMAQYGSVRDFEIQLRAKDGTLKDALITATQHYAEDGTLIGYQGIIRDMTEHKRAEQEKLRLIAIERELTLARDIQRNLLPPARPAWAGLDVVCYSAPVHAVGGDFYAYYTFDPTSSEPIKRYAIAVGDVAGNGMPAALLMAFSLASFHSTVRQRVAPDEFLAHMDNAIAEYTHATNQHCALVYMDITVPSVRVLPRGEHSLPGAVVPPGAGGTLPVPGHRHDSSVVGTVRFANAGCVLPIVKRASGMVRWVDVIGVPLGVGMGTRFDYKMATLELSSGDMIILSSDGVIEATGPDRELFGFDRLEHAIREGPDTSASAMLGHLRAAIGAFVGEQESHDDMTLVVIQV
jgi:PAS domain S-box-containing protein